MKLVYSGLLERLYMKEQQYYVLVHVCTLLIPKCQHFIWPYLICCTCFRLSAAVAGA